MNFVDLVLKNKLSEAKDQLVSRLTEITAKRLAEAKRYVAEDMLEKVVIDEARNPNLIKMGRITKVRRRIRRNAKGRIVVQKNKRRSGIKGYRIAGNTVRRIPANVRLRKARLLKRSWKTTRRAKLRRSLLKRKMSMRRRSSLGLK
jgi:phenylpyruvate tautomerase PptA (4-oxalocrotonate tautomerase family)